jgi:hypothetical protein
MSRRQRSRHRYQSGEHFALLPCEVLESAAYRALPDWAKPVLVALAGKYRGARNGDISLTWTEARALGVSGEWKLRAGIKLADSVGLIDITRPGGNVAGGEKIPSLYAVGWLPIEPSDKFEQPLGTLLKAANRWANWSRPDDWPERVKAERLRAQGKKRHHTRVGKLASHVRGDVDCDHNTRAERSNAFLATHVGAISRDLGGDTEAKVFRLLASQPHLSDFDIAKALNWKIDPHRVRTLRSSQSRGAA